jgi:hypothetical protein
MLVYANMQQWGEKSTKKIKLIKLHFFYLQLGRGRDRKKTKRTRAHTLM